MNYSTYEGYYFNLAGYFLEVRKNPDEDTFSYCSAEINSYTYLDTLKTCIENKFLVKVDSIICKLLYE